MADQEGGQLHHPTTTEPIRSPSQWPGLRGWPRLLAGTDWTLRPCNSGASLSHVLGEACVAILVGLAYLAMADCVPEQLMMLASNLPDREVSRSSNFLFLLSKKKQKKTVLVLQLESKKQGRGALFFFFSCLCRCFMVLYCIYYSFNKDCQIFQRLM